MGLNPYDHPRVLQGKFLHLTLGIGDLSVSVHVHALGFLKIEEMSVV